MLFNRKLSLALIAPLFSIFLTSMAISGLALAGESPLKKVRGAHDLEKVRRSQFSDTYVKPGVDFSHYKTIYVDEARFAYKEIKTAKGNNGRLPSTSSIKEYPINKENRRLFEKIVRETFRSEFAKAKHFEIVDILNTDEQTLVMRAVVADITSRVPPQAGEQTRLYMSSVGSASLVLEFRDNTSRDVLARVAERSLIGDTAEQANGVSQPVNRDTVIADVKRWATSAAVKLRRVLDSALEG